MYSIYNEETITSFKINIHCNLRLECGATIVVGLEKNPLTTFFFNCGILFVAFVF